MRSGAVPVETHETIEDAFSILSWDSRPVVIDQDVEPVFELDAGQPDMPTVLAGIGDQVGQAAAQRIRTHREDQLRSRLDRQARPFAPHCRDDILEQQRDIGVDRRFGALAAGEIEVQVDQPLHVGDIRFELGDRRVAAEQLQAELHPGQRRAQIVRHAGEHLGALADLALDALAHANKGHRGLPHFEGAFGFDERHRPALAEFLGGGRQAAQRLHLVAQEDCRNRQQHDRRADHP